MKKISSLSMVLFALCVLSSGIQLVSAEVVRGRPTSSVAANIKITGFEKGIIKIVDPKTGITFTFKKESKDSPILQLTNGGWIPVQQLPPIMASLQIIVVEGSLKVGGKTVEAGQTAEIRVSEKTGEALANVAITPPPAAKLEVVIITTPKEESTTTKTSTGESASKDAVSGSQPK